MKKPNIHQLFFSLRHPSLSGAFNIFTHMAVRERIALFTSAAHAARNAGRGLVCVEIGSYLGASSVFIAAGAGPRSRVFCIDTWSNDAMSEGQRDTYQEFSKNTRRYAKRITPLRGWSHDPSVQRRIQDDARRIDLLFIDGDHSKEAVERDWELYSPLLATRAIVLMHDIGWATGVQEIVTERVRPYARREFRLPNLWWAEIER